MEDARIKLGIVVFFTDIFGGDLQYFLVTPHWMCTNIRGPLCFSSSLLLSEGTPTVPWPETNPGPTNWQAGVLTIELCLTPHHMGLLQHKH